MQHAQYYNDTARSPCVMHGTIESIHNYAC